MKDSLYVYLKNRISVLYINVVSCVGSVGSVRNIKKVGVLIVKSKDG